jgi:hypothetical protein
MHPEESASRKESTFSEKTTWLQKHVKSSLVKDLWTIIGAVGVVVALIASAVTVYKLFLNVTVTGIQRMTVKRDSSLDEIEMDVVIYARNPSLSDKLLGVSRASLVANPASEKAIFYGASDINFDNSGLVIPIVPVQQNSYALARCQIKAKAAQYSGLLDAKSRVETGRTLLVEFNQDGKSLCTVAFGFDINLPPKTTPTGQRDSVESYQPFTVTEYR